MATAPKSNSSALAIWGAMKDVREGRTLPVPRHLKDSHYKGAKRLGHGEGYKYSHDFSDGFVEQDYLGIDKIYYRPTDRGYEAVIAKKRVDRLHAREEQASVEDEHHPGGEHNAGVRPSVAHDAAGADDEDAADSTSDRERDHG
jgi:putative ATPase